MPFIVCKFSASVRTRFPLHRFFSSRRLPPCARASSRESANPIPSLFFPGEAKLRRRCACDSGGMPEPLSAIRMFSCPFSIRAFTVSSPFSECVACLAAFSPKFKKCVPVPSEKPKRLPLPPPGKDERPSPSRKTRVDPPNAQKSAGKFRRMRRV